MIRKILPLDKSFAVIIPKKIAKALHLKVGEFLDIKQVGEHIECQPVYMEKKRNNLQNYVEKHND